MDTYMNLIIPFIGALIWALTSVFFYKRNSRINLVMTKGIKPIKEIYEKLAYIKLYYEAQSYFDWDFNRPYNELPKNAKTSNLVHLQELSDLLVLNSFWLKKEILKLSKSFIDEYAMICSIEVALVSEPNQDTIDEATRWYQKGIKDIEDILDKIKAYLKLPL